MMGQQVCLVYIFGIFCVMATEKPLHPSNIKGCIASSPTAPAGALLQHCKVSLPYLTQGPAWLDLRCFILKPFETGKNYFRLKEKNKYTVITIMLFQAALLIFKQHLPKAKLRYQSRATEIETRKKLMHCSPSFSISTCKLCQLRLSYQLSSSVHEPNGTLPPSPHLCNQVLKDLKEIYSNLDLLISLLTVSFGDSLLTQTREKIKQQQQKKTSYQKSIFQLVFQNPHTRTGFSLFKRIISKTKSEYNGRILTCLLSSLTALFIIRVSLLQHIIIIRSCTQ